jgi:hypothetical protein
MPVERKRKAADNESAVAKLRRFRASATPTSSREESPSQPVVVAVKPGKAQKNGAPSLKSEREVIQDPRAKKLIANLPISTQTEEVSNDNRFSVLPYKQSWDGNRTFERLSNRRLRVELAEGTSLVILGQCSVWVKRGVISVAGATLRAGPTRHKLSTSEIAAVPGIDVVEGLVELELGSIDYASASRQKAFGHTDSAVHSDLSFRVLGLDARPAGDDIGHLRILSLQPTHFEVLKHHAVRPRLLFCGSRSAGITTLARCFLNRMLTASPAQVALFIDLDPVAPQFVAPGMIGISRITGPVLDQTFTRGGQTKAIVIRQHFIGAIDAELSQSSWHERCLNDLTSVYEEVRGRFPEAGVIVCSPNGLLSPDKVEQIRLWGLLQLDGIVRVDSESNYLAEMAEPVESDVIKVYTVPTINENPHTSRQHSLTMRNYLGSTILRQGHHVFQHAGSSIEELTYRGSDTMKVNVAQIDQYMPGSWMERLLPASIMAIMILSDSEHQKLLACRKVCKTSGIVTVPALSTIDMNIGQVRCLGIARVEGIDTIKRTISLRTPVVPEIREERAKGIVNLLLVVQPPNKDGRYGL